MHPPPQPANILATRNLPPATEMYTQCPHCQAVFKVTTSELTAYDGNVRCGECGQVFNGLVTLSVLPPEGAVACEATTHLQVPAEPPPEPPQSVETPPPEPEGPAAPVADGQVPDPAGIPSADTTGTDTDGSNSDDHGPGKAPEALPPAVPRIIKDELAGPSVAGRHDLLRTLSLGVLSLLLIALLAGQAVYHERHRLAAYPEIAPVLHWMCDRLDCTLPPPRDPEAFRLSSRNIYSHPNVSGALMVQATLTNQASFPQPHPLVELSFRDLQGELLAVRRFTPEEYLQHEPVTDAPVEPGAPVQLHLEIEDPGPSAVAYEFRFL